VEVCTEQNIAFGRGRELAEECDTCTGETVVNVAAPVATLRSNESAHLFAHKSKGRKLVTIGWRSPAITMF